MSDTDKDTPKEEKKPEIRDYFYHADKNGEEFISLAKDANGEPIMMRNPEYRAYAGVPNRDIPAAEFAAYPLHIQRAIEASPVHLLSKPRPPASAPKAEAKPAEPAKE